MSTAGTELIKPDEQQVLVALPELVACANCGMPVSDKYCGHCGQRLEHHGHSLSDFIGEAAEVITHADSRVWRTFMPLLFRPGFLTQQYLAGRRASYLPPFRLYIVLSVVFFLMISLVPYTSVKLGNLEQARAEVQKQLDESKDPADQEALRKSLQGLSALEVKPGKQIKSTTCTPQSGPSWGPEWLRARMANICQKATADSGKQLIENMIHNAGKALFIFLPFIAAVMKLLYWHPRRYYVEHLLLLLHNHAFVFVSVSFLLALKLVIHSEAVAGWLSTALWLYTMWYLFRSMRRVYGQGRLRTFAKFFVLGCVYFICGLLTFVLTAVYSAVTL